MGFPEPFLEMRAHINSVESNNCVKPQGQDPRSRIRGVFEKYRDCMLYTNNTCNSDKSFVF